MRSEELDKFIDAHLNLVPHHGRWRCFPLRVPKRTLFEQTLGFLTKQLLEDDPKLSRGN